MKRIKKRGRNKLLKFVNNFLISCKGVLHDINSDLDVATIFNNLQTCNNTNILGVKRIKRKTLAEDGKTIPE